MTKTIEVGTLARWKKGRKADRRHTFTVREVGATEVMIDNGTPGVPDFPANGATVLVCVKPGEIEPWGDEPPTFTMAAKLASSLAAMTVERDEAHRERDRLARVCAVERGDEGAALDGWTRMEHVSGWRARDRHGRGWTVRYDRLGDGWHTASVYLDGIRVYSGCPTALEAMEAADKIREP